RCRSERTGVRHDRARSVLRQSAASRLPARAMAARNGLRTTHGRQDGSRPALKASSIYSTAAMRLLRAGGNSVSRRKARWNSGMRFFLVATLFSAGLRPQPKLSRRSSSKVLPPTGFLGNEPRNDTTFRRWLSDLPGRCAIGEERRGKTKIRAMTKLLRDQGVILSGVSVIQAAWR